MKKSKIGIVLDAYKVNKYKQELNKMNFVFYIKRPKDNITLIKVHTTRIKDLAELCENLESNFANRYN